MTIRGMVLLVSPCFLFVQIGQKSRQNMAVFGIITYKTQIPFCVLREGGKNEK